MVDFEGLIQKVLFDMIPYFITKAENKVKVIHFVEYFVLYMFLQSYDVIF